MPKHVYTAWCSSSGFTSIDIHQSSSHINKLDDSTMNMTSRDANTGAVRSDVATMNMRAYDSSISKLLWYFCLCQLICCQVEDEMFFQITQ